MTTSYNCSSQTMALAVLRLARQTPELMPALLWLLVTGRRLKQMQRIVESPPTDSELAALAYCADPCLVELIWQQRALRRQVQTVDFEQRGLLETRIKAAKKLGMGIESLVALKEAKPDRDDGGPPP